MPDRNCRMPIFDCRLDGRKLRPTHARAGDLTHKPAHLRSPVTRGLLRGTDVQTEQVARNGGSFGAGLIRGVSLTTRGEAIGHFRWLDDEFIESVYESAAGAPKGVKARFTHPGLSGDGLGTFLGRTCDFALTDDGRKKVVGDLHFSQAAHRSPDGDLADYVMDLADSDPDMFGASIVFDVDVEAEIEFVLAHGATIEEDECGEYIDLTNFKSPDPENVKNLPHARLSELRAADIVDEPAANPDGLFHREQQFAQEADALMSYALGLSESAPAVAAFSSVHPDRVKAFVARFMDSHNLKIANKETVMAETDKVQAEDPGRKAASQAATTESSNGSQEPVAGSQEAAQPKTDPKPEDKPAESGAEGKEAQTPAGETPATQSASAKATADESAMAAEGRQECKRFIDVFGAAQGGQWYADGLTFAQAQEKHAEALKAENDALKKRLAAAGEAAGETAPLTFQPEGDKGNKGNKFSNVLTPGLAQFAASITLPRDRK